MQTSQFARAVVLPLLSLLGGALQLAPPAFQIDIAARLKKRQ